MGGGELRGALTLGVLGLPVPAQDRWPAPSRSFTRHAQVPISFSCIIDWDPKLGGGGRRRSVTNWKWAGAAVRGRAAFVGV